MASAELRPWSYSWSSVVIALRAETSESRAPRADRTPFRFAMFVLYMSLPWQIAHARGASRQSETSGSCKRGFGEGLYGSWFVSRSWLSRGSDKEGAYRIHRTSSCTLQQGHLNQLKTSTSERVRRRRGGVFGTGSYRLRERHRSALLPHTYPRVRSLPQRPGPPIY